MPLHHHAADSLLKKQKSVTLHLKYRSTAARQRKESFKLLPASMIHLPLDKLSQNELITSGVGSCFLIGFVNPSSIKQDEV